MIPLSEKHPFKTDEFVKVVSKNDFEKIWNIMKSLKTERSQLKKEIENLNYLVDNQKDYITKLEKLHNIESKKKDKSHTFRELLGF